jgi:3-hydroxyacyl-CoA dehydrogenase
VLTTATGHRPTRAYSDKLISSQIAKGRAKTADKEALLARITPTADYAQLKGCDLIIEAVFEDRAVKEEATKKAQAVVGPDVVFASNTSTLPITSLAETSLTPEQFIGVHFFSPVEKMMLTEIIMGEKTDAKALATAMDFVRAIKKTPIVVNDCRGFYVNRCVGNYMVEAHAMVMEGVPPAMIENAAKMAGMPVGPLALNDEVGIDLSWRILQAAKTDLGANAVNPAQEKLIEAMAVKEGRSGRKNGKGFYDYPANGPKSLWPGLAKIVGKRLDPDAISVKDLKDRFLFTVALEAARCMEEGIVTDPREADVGSILGFLPCALFGRRRVLRSTAWAPRPSSPRQKSSRLNTVPVEPGARLSRWPSAVRPSTAHIVRSERRREASAYPSTQGSRWLRRSKPLALSNLAANRLIWHGFCGTSDCQNALEMTPSHSGNQESPHGHCRLPPPARGVWADHRQHPLPHARSPRYPAELHLAAARPASALPRA